jgi:uncharacterized damage-inducible protein DinB
MNLYDISASGSIKPSSVATFRPFLGDRGSNTNQSFILTSALSTFAWFGAFAKRTILSFILLMGMSSTLLLFSQSPLQSELHTKWLNGAEYTLEIARMMPAENYDFRPVEESMTFGEQLLHITANMDWLGKNHLSAQSHSMPLRDTIYDKEELIRILEEGFENAAKAIKGLPSEQLDDVVEFFAGPMTKRQIMHLMHDHHTHHRGQLIVYLRLNGLQPPRYMGW